MNPASGGKRRGHGLRVVLGILAALVIALAAAVAVYAGSYSRPDETALAALQEATVSDGMYAFGDAAAQTGLILYPGGKVAHTAYAPLARQIADAADILVVVPKLPLHLAVLEPYAADRVMAAYPAVSDWKVGGHSLGGAMAASYAANHPDAVSGVLLLAAYATGPLSTPALSLYGDRDTVLDRERYREALPYLPEGSTELVIPGGNHAGFGNYGAQKGDTAAEIPCAEQQRITAEAVCDWLSGVMRLEDAA